MDATRQQCIAVSDGGERCDNIAAIGSRYCSLHIDETTHGLSDIASTTESDGAAAPDAAPAPVRTQPVPSEPEMELLRHELESLKRELMVQIPDIELSDLNPAQLMRLFNRTIGDRLPLSQAAFFEDVERNLEDTSFTDFADPDMLRGMAMLTYYSARAQADTLREPFNETLRRLPGYSLICRVHASIVETSVEDVLDPDTWKGLWYLVTYSAQLRTEELFSDDDEST